MRTYSRLFLIVGILALCLPVLLLACGGEEPASPTPVVESLPTVTAEAAGGGDVGRATPTEAAGSGDGGGGGDAVGATPTEAAGTGNGSGEDAVGATPT